MKTYDVTITKELKFTIEIEESVWTDEAIKDWSKHFIDADDSWDIVKWLSELIARNGFFDFHEGFGYLYVVNEDEVNLSYIYDNIDKYCEGIKVIVDDTDGEYDVVMDEE